MWGSCLFHLLIFLYTLLSSVFSHPCTVSNSVNVLEPREVVTMAPREVVMEPREVVVGPRELLLEARGLVVEPREVVMEPRHAAAVILKHHPARHEGTPVGTPRQRLAQVGDDGRQRSFCDGPTGGRAWGWEVPLRTSRSIRLRSTATSSSCRASMQLGRRGAAIRVHPENHVGILRDGSWYGGPFHCRPSTGSESSPVASTTATKWSCVGLLPRVRGPRTLTNSACSPPRAVRTTCSLQ